MAHIPGSDPELWVWPGRRDSRPLDRRDEWCRPGERRDPPRASAAGAEDGEQGRAGAVHEVLFLSGVRDGCRALTPPDVRGSPGVDSPPSRCGASLPERRLPAGSQMQDSAVSPEGTHRPRRRGSGGVQGAAADDGTSAGRWVLGQLVGGRQAVDRAALPADDPPSPLDHPGPRPRKSPGRRPSAHRRRPVSRPASRPACAPRTPRPSRGPTRACGAGPRRGRIPTGRPG